MPLTANTGPIAAAAWLAELGLHSHEPRWHVEILIGTGDDPPHDEAPTLLRVDLYSEEWGYRFRHAARESWIRVTDVAFVHGRDDHALLPGTPALRNIGSLARRLESRFQIRLKLPDAVIRTSIQNADAAIRTWLTIW
jgi:hypothetical protein